jgi:putative phosphonate catabolism associated alcohol dehydrogenase
MRTSRIAVFHGAGRPLTLESVTVPALREGEILVRNEYATLCRSDLNTYSGKRTEKTPTILGHETVGIIEELGPGAPATDARGLGLRPGDRVTWAVFAANPDSELARAGIPQKGPDLFKYGHEALTPDSTLHGGLADYCVLRRYTPVLRLVAPIPLPLLALINCAVATVAGSLRLAGPLHSRNVLIAGAGMLGLLACSMCRGSRARRIIALDVEPRRLVLAREFGADFALAMPSEGGSLRSEVTALLGAEPVTVALDYSGAPAAMETLLESLGTGGTAVFIGATFPQRPIQISAEQVIRKVQTIKGLHNYNEADLVAAASFMEEHGGEFPFARLVHDQFDLAAVNEAFEYGLESGAHRVGIRISGGS